MISVLWAESEIADNMSQRCFILKLAKDYINPYIHSDVMSYGKKWHTLPFRVFVCVCPPNLCPPLIYV
jgi:hypothetical protein